MRKMFFARLLLITLCLGMLTGCGKPNSTPVTQDPDLPQEVVKDDVAAAEPAAPETDSSAEASVDFSDFALSVEDGVYPTRLSVSVTGARGVVYYTLDGTDPVLEGKANETAAEMPEALELAPGEYVVCAQCVTEEGLESPVVRGIYTVTTPFAAHSNTVAYDNKYEYVVDGGALYLYDAATGEQLNTLVDKDVKSVRAIWSKNNNIDKYKEYDSVMTGYLASVLAETVEETSLFVSTSKDTYKLTYQNGKLVEEKDSMVMPSRILGNCWLHYSSSTNLYKRSNYTIGTEEVADKAVLLTSDIALWVDSVEVKYNNGSGTTYRYNIMACDPDGSNQRVIWEGKETRYRIELLAVTDRHILFSYGLRNNDGNYVNRIFYIYDMLKNGVQVNPLVPDGSYIAGCTPNAVYLRSTDNGPIQRISVDYSKFE